MSIWKVYAKKADFKAIGARFGINQVIARIIRNRDVTEDSQYEEYLYGGLESMHDPVLMKGISEAVAVIKNAIADGKRIRIIGDYDIDGVCSICILHKGLIMAGADADYVVPDRITDGYGINENLIRNAIADGIDMIITCDNGIAAYDAIAYAKENGITIIVTDHHDVPFRENADGTREYIIPPADVVVDPKQSDCGYPFKELCGALVAWKMIQHLLGQKPKDSDFLMYLLELGAIATVGDIVSLQGENRTIVKQGLRHIHAGTRNVGLKTLMDVCGVAEADFNAYHIGFVVGPCLNASGRLDSAVKAIRLLETDDEKQAQALAAELKLLNDERKDMTERGVENACNTVEREYGNNIPQIIVVHLDNCHESVAGIIAGRVREKYYRPCIIFTDSIGEHGIYKGSGRSIEPYDMFAGVNRFRDMLEKFGGHHMAAGMSIRSERFEEFRECLVNSMDMSDEELTPVTWIDVPMPLDYVTEEVTEQLQLLEPFGKDNPKPVFADKNLTVVRKNIIGKNRNVLKMILQTVNGRRLEAVKFHVTQEEADNMKTGDIISIVYYPDINTFNGNSTLQMIISEIKH